MLFAALFAVNLLQPDSLQYDQLDGIRALRLPWGETVTRGIGHTGHWFHLSMIGVVLVLVFALYALGGAYRRNRQRTDLWMFLAAGLLLLTGLEGILARLSIIDFIEMGPIGIIAMVVVMSLAVSLDTQLRLRNSERNFRSLFQNLPTSMVAIDANSRRIVQVNDIAREISGFSAEELTGKTAADLTHPDDLDLQEYQQNYEQLSKGLVDRMSYEKRYLRKDGSSFSGYTSISTLRDDNGQVIRFISSTIDITGQKLAQAARIMESEKNIALLRNASDGIHILNFDGNIIEASDSFCAMLGYRRDEMMGMNVRQWDAGFADPEQLMKAVREQFAKQVRSQFETLHRRKDGTLFPVEVSGYPLLLDGKPVLFNSSRDISKRKLLDETLHFHSDILNNVMEGIFLVRARDNLIVFTNPQFDKMFGYEHGELLGKHVRVINAPGEKSPEETASEIIEALESKGTWSGEILHVKKDGTTFWAGAKVSTLFHPEFGRVWVSAHEDITERKRIQNNLHEIKTRFSTVIEQSPVGIVFGRDGIIFDANAAFLEMYGYSDISEVLGQPVINHVAPQFQAEIEERIRQRVAGIPTDTSYEIAGLRKNGSQFPLYVSAKRVMLEDGPFTVAFEIDITERKQAEESLKESEQRLRTIIEQSPVGISFSRNGMTIEVNAAFLEMFGYEDIDEVRGTSVLNRIAPQCRDQIEQRIRLRTLDEPTDASYETTGLRKDGSQFPLFVSVRSVMLKDGPMSSAILIDFTERKNAEADLRIASIAFESQEGIEITDANNRILRVNQAFTRITGYAAEEVIGKKPNLLSSGRHDAEFYAAMWDSLDQTGSWEGELWNRRKNGEIYPEQITITAVKDAGGQVTNYIASFIDISDRKAAADKINQLAFFDQLTLLPNRQLLLDRLHQSLALRLRSKLQGALLFIDLDNFKTLNDLYGHETGDLLLKQVALRLSECVREGDTVARLGGDEFVVLLENLSEFSIEAAKQTETIAYKILTAIGQPYQLGNHVHHSTPSIGITLFDSHHETTENLLKQADIAMYQAKKDGRNTIRFFDLQMQSAINTRAALESELRQALTGRQFKLFYHIQVDNFGHPLGAEALIRWIHPEHGLVSPAQFIPIAEETGLILPIGFWVLETACAQIKEWERDAVCRNLVVCVNVSAKQFHQVDFVAQVQATIQRHSIDPNRIKLELTESMLVDDIEIIIVTMNALKAIGVQISLDDFGTGYSSLQYLKRLPLDQLKIDQSFVRDIATDSSDKAIVRTIIAMAKSLELEVIAEGVESEDQRKFLLENGCDRFQGYLFGKPVPIDQFEAMLKHMQDGNPDKQIVQS
ncbi:MAG: PAS domain S-box protein [Gallionella sp.]